ncbi:hypothetical protein RUND412_009719 [Rhizina undulata]
MSINIKTEVILKESQQNVKGNLMGLPERLAYPEYIYPVKPEEFPRQPSSMKVILPSEAPELFEEINRQSIVTIGSSYFNKLNFYDWNEEDPTTNHQKDIQGNNDSESLDESKEKESGLITGAPINLERGVGDIPLHNRNNSKALFFLGLAKAPYLQEPITNGANEDKEKRKILSGKKAKQRKLAPRTVISPDRATIAAGKSPKIISMISKIESWSYQKTFRHFFRKTLSQEDDFPKVVSFKPDQQAQLYTFLECTASKACNNFLIDQMSVLDMCEIERELKKQKHFAHLVPIGLEGEVVSFMFGMETQCRVVLHNIRNLNFGGGLSDFAGTILEEWKMMIPHFQKRTYCAPDLVIIHHCVAIENLLNLFGTKFWDVKAFTEKKNIMWDIITRGKLHKGGEGQNFDKLVAPDGDHRGAAAANIVSRTGQDLQEFELEGAGQNASGREANVFKWPERKRPAALDTTGLRIKTGVRRPLDEYHEHLIQTGNNITKSADSVPPMNFESWQEEYTQRAMEAAEKEKKKSHRMRTIMSLDLDAVKNMLAIPEDGDFDETETPEN